MIEIFGYRNGAEFPHDVADEPIYEADTAVDAERIIAQLECRGLRVVVMDPFALADKGAN